MPMKQAVEPIVAAVDAISDTKLRQLQLKTAK